MSLMKSPAGDMEISVSKITVEDNRLITIGKFGIWDSTIYFTVSEVFELIKLMLNWAVICFIFKLPMLLLKSKVKWVRKS